MFKKIIFVSPRQLEPTSLTRVFIYNLKESLKLFNVDIEEFKYLDYNETMSYLNITNNTSDTLILEVSEINDILNPVGVKFLLKDSMLEMFTDCYDKVLKTNTISDSVDFSKLEEIDSSFNCKYLKVTFNKQSVSDDVNFKYIFKVINSNTNKFINELTFEYLKLECSLDINNSLLDPKERYYTISIPDIKSFDRAKHIASEIKRNFNIDVVLINDSNKK